MRGTLEAVVAACGLAVLSPVLGVIALAVKLGDGGPILFRQRRIGQFGRPFSLFKFRTMIVDAERRGAQLTVGADPRITRVGDWLRKTKLDELPQLLNVVRGEMALVGPRPEVPHYVALYTRDERRVLDWKPGLTDPASLAYFAEADRLALADDPERMYREIVMPEKIALNLDYAARRSVRTDLGVIMATVGRMVGLRRPKFGAQAVCGTQIQYGPESLSRRAKARLGEELAG